MNLTNAPAQPQASIPLSKALIVAGLLLGMGFAGFFDGIVLHQVLQWHHMLSSVQPTTNIPGLEVNTFWDGVFHIGAYGLTASGLMVLWRSRQYLTRPKSSSALGGAILLGAGLFNVVEGLIDHHLLGIHHVKPGPHQLAWDLGFLGIGAALAIIGWLVLSNARR